MLQCFFLFSLRHLFRFLLVYCQHCLFICFLFLFSVFSSSFLKYIGEAKRAGEQINAEIMKCFKVITYSPKNIIPQHSFFILCKGLNSGKPLDKSTANCFVVSCNDGAAREIAYWVCYGLWKSKSLHKYLVGSVIEFLRIGDFRTIFNNAMAEEKIRHAEHEKMIGTLRKMDILEKELKQNILLINDTKKALYFKYTHKR